MPLIIPQIHLETIPSLKPIQINPQPEVHQYSLRLVVASAESARPNVLLNEMRSRWRVQTLAHTLLALLIASVVEVRNELEVGVAVILGGPVQATMTTRLTFATMFGKWRAAAVQNHHQIRLAVLLAVPEFQAAEAQTDQLRLDTALWVVLVPLMLAMLSDLDQAQPREAEA